LKGGRIFNGSGRRRVRFIKASLRRSRNMFTTEAPAVIRNTPTATSMRGRPHCGFGARAYPATAVRVTRAVMRTFIRIRKSRTPI
jgi:transposase